MYISTRVGDSTALVQLGQPMTSAHTSVDTTRKSATYVNDIHVPLNNLHRTNTSKNHHAYSQCLNLAPNTLWSGSTAR